MRLAVLSIILLPALLLAACDAPDTSDTAKVEAEQLLPPAPAPLDTANAGQVPPEADFAREDGASATIPKAPGKIVFVNLWATWCAPCVEEMPALAALEDRYSADDFEMFAISQDLNGWADIERFRKRHAIALPTLYADVKGATAAAYGATGLPVSIIYDRDGRELARLSGPLDWTAPEIIAWFDRIVGANSSPAPSAG